MTRERFSREKCAGIQVVADIIILIITMIIIITINTIIIITITMMMIIIINFEVLEPSSFYPAAWMEQSKLTQGRTKKDWEKVLLLLSSRSLLTVNMLTVINIIVVIIDVLTQD